MARPGMRLRRRVERPAQRRHHIGAAAPVAADGRAAMSRRACLHVARSGSQQPIADHVERDLAGGARGDRDRHGVAGACSRACRARARAGPACRRWLRRNSRHRRRSTSPDRRLAGSRRPAGSGPSHRERKMRGRVGRDIERAVGDALGGLDRLEVPAAVLAVPLIAAARPSAARNAGPCAPAACRRARRARRRSVAFSPSPSDRPENSGLTPIIGPVGVIGSVELALDRAAAGLGQRGSIACAGSGRVRRRQFVEC